MKKIILITVLTVALLLSVSVSALAEQADTEAYSESITEQSAEQMNVQTAPVSEALKDAVLEHTSEIFCVLTFIASMITAVFYKKGLLPSVASSMSLINEGTGAVLSKVCDYSQSTDSAIGELCERAEPVLKRIADFAALAERIATENERLGNELCKIESDSDRLKRIVALQNEMLYAAFMSSSLPQYQKDNIGKVYMQVKELSGVEGA